MGKDVVISERICGDDDSANARKVYNTFARRLRAKAVGLLELVKMDRQTDEAAKLIHRSVSTYLKQKGWQTLGALKEEVSIRAESLYVEICTRYLHRLLRHCKLEKITSQRVWEEWVDGKVFYSNSEWGRSQFKFNSTGAYPFFGYAACYVFLHAESVEKHGANSYPILHDVLTEQLVRLSFSVLRFSATSQELLAKDFDAIFVAFLYGLALYCKHDLATRSPALGEVFWERALNCALIGNPLNSYRLGDAVSLALQNVITVKQICLEGTSTPLSLKLALQHSSIKSLRLVDKRGHAVTLLWLFTQHNWLGDYKTALNVLIERANDRGEDVRHPCGPEGNLVETLMKKPLSNARSFMLEALRKYYNSRSWPFEYDLYEICKLK